VVSDSGSVTSRTASPFASVSTEPSQNASALQSQCSTVQRNTSPRRRGLRSTSRPETNPSRSARTRGSSFGAPTEVGLLGESRGLLREPRRWSMLSLPTMSIGQEISVTALQLVTAVGAIANGGTLVQPRLVRATFDAEGRELRRFAPRPVRQAVSPETARTLTRLLVRVVEEGTGRNGAIPGYAVAGKTGTSRIASVGGYVTDRYTAVFAGIAPASDPRLVAVVVIDDPQGEKYYGGDVAAPVFARIVSGALRVLAVPPDALPDPPLTVVAQARVGP